MLKTILPTLVVVIALTGCQAYQDQYMSSTDSLYGDSPVARFSAAAASPADEAQTEQMLIWTGSMTIEVLSMSNAVAQITKQTQAMGGYVESSRQRGHTDYQPSSELVLRVPSEKLPQILTAMDGVGEVTAKSLSSKDITERYVDMQARLETNKKLRDRLENLLDRADEIKDVLAIEKELTRLQADIDSMTARLKTMKGKVDYASLTIDLMAKKHDKVLGPLGYVWEGTVWCVKKLFVWQDETYEQQ